MQPHRWRSLYLACQRESNEKTRGHAVQQELDDLQGISQKPQIATNRTAQAARSMRYPVKLSTYSYELLTSFMQAHRLALALGIINEHVNLQVWLP